MLNRYALTMVAAAGAGLLVQSSVHAAEDNGWSPHLSVEIPIEVQNDWAYESDDPTAQFNTLFTKIEPAITVDLGAGVSAFAGLVFEPLQGPPVSGGNRTFDDQGLFVEVLTLTYENGPFALFGGKFGPNFAIAWDAAPGVFGTDLAEEYEITERIGFGTSATAAAGVFGSYSLSVSTFFLDTSGLAESALTRRRKTRRADGGPGNTGGFDSIAAGLDGGTFPWAPGLRYHVSVVHQGQGIGGGEDERRLAAAVEYAIPMTERLTITPLVEWVDFHDADGTDGTDRHYLTGGLGLASGPWNVALSGTLKETETAIGLKTNEEQVQVSVGYTFENGLAIDLGWKRARNAGVDTDTFGTLVAYTLAF